MKSGFAKKVIIKSQRQFMYGSNFYGSDVKRKMDTEHRSVSAVPPVCTMKMDTEHRSVSAVPPVWTRNMEVDSVIRFLHNRRVNTGQVGGSLKKVLS